MKNVYSIPTYCKMPSCTSLDRRMHSRVQCPIKHQPGRVPPCPFPAHDPPWAAATINSIPPRLVLPVRELHMKYSSGSGFSHWASRVADQVLRVQVSVARPSGVRRRQGATWRRHSSFLYPPCCGWTSGLLSFSATRMKLPQM